MSLSTQFEEEINNYADQLSAYREQINEYKNQLLQAKGDASDFTKSLVTEIGIPIGTELVRAGASKLLGSSAGDLVGKLAGTGFKQAAGAEGSLAENLAKTAKQAMSGVEPEADAEATGGVTSALSSAREGLMSVVNRVRGGAQEAVSGADEAIAGAQEGLTSALESTAQSVGNRLAASAGDLIQAQVNRLSGLAGENDIVSSLKSAYSSIRAPEDTSIFGDVELTNMASAVPRAGIPDLSLPFEATFEAPLSKFSLDAVPDAFSGLGDLATNTLAQASKFASGFTEPLAQSGLSSNIIARAFMGGKPDMPIMDIPDSVVPTQEEALAMLSQQVRPVITSDMLPEGAGELVSGFMGRLTAGVPDITESATSALSNVTSTLEGVTSAVSGAVKGATSAVEGATSAVAEAGAEAGAEVAAGAEGGPVGLVVGGLVAVGTFIFDLFHHHDSTPMIAPPAPPPMSVPSYQPGLATSN